MPVLICPRCRRANPELAAYCYFDGYELRGPTDGAAFRMPSEFVFPSGRRCRTYDEFAQGCQEEWSSARDLLHRGAFGQFFGNCGRADLVRAAADANVQGSPDAALTTFLAALPGVRTQTPKLDINPRRFLLGSLLAGETRQLSLTITNTAQGCLQGTASITEGQDLASLADGRAVHEVPVNAPRQQAVMLHLNTRGLPANQGHGAKLTVVTNGGVAEVPLRLDLVARPFSSAPFQGVKAQRELAERMRQQPKAAVPLLESGDVRRWFETNGWTYPVSGPEVRGVAAVQQFFEAMGLSKPPAVQVSPMEVRLRCQYPESARFQLSLSTPAKKWVYATISSESAWLKVPQPQVSGPQQTTFLIEIDSSRMTTVGTRGEARIKVIANGGQTIDVPVVADVTGMPSIKPGLPSVRPAPGVPAAAPWTSGTGRASFLASLLILPLLVLLFRLAMVPLSDGILRSAAMRAAAQKLDVHTDPNGKLGSVAGWLRLPWVAILTAENAQVAVELFEPGKQGSIVTADLRDYFVSAFVRLFVLLTWWLGGILGALVLFRRGGTLDVPWGFVAGSIAGVAAAATLASIFLVVELIPHAIWHLATGDSGGPVAWLGWIVLAVICWLIIGTAVGVVFAVLPPLRRLVLLPLQRLPAALCRMMGLPRAADFWSAPA
jgi:hypothetical protein